MPTKTLKPHNKPGTARLNIFHYDPAYDGSGLEPSGFSYVFPFRKDNIGMVMELCQVFEGLVCGDTYDIPSPVIGVLLPCFLASPIVPLCLPS